MSRQKRKPVGEAVIGSATASTRRRPYKRQRCISEENEQDNGIPDVANTPEHDRKPNKCDNDCIVEEVNHAGGHENFSEQPHEVQVQPSSQSPATHGRDDIMAVDDEIEEERIVEAHLSSHNGFCFLGEVDTSPTCVEEEAVPDVLKREASPDNFSIPWRPPTYGEDAKPDPEGSEEEGDDLEIHLTSRNQHIIFGNRVDMSVRQEKKQQQRLVKREDSKSPGLEHPGNGEVPSHPVKLEEEEDVVVEVHISSKDIRVASARVRAEGARVPKAEPQ
ncbi:hypothetical protein C8Q77DRAFT_1154852 [Trametes polyzona]|nr:hypothetical protein C8Q77DRAFT_1154852 [Trametes polyzona]